MLQWIWKFLVRLCGWKASRIKVERQEMRTLFKDAVWGLSTPDHQNASKEQGVRLFAKVFAEWKINSMIHAGMIENEWHTQFGEDNKVFAIRASLACIQNILPLGLSETGISRCVQEGYEAAMAWLNQVPTAEEQARNLIPFIQEKGLLKTSLKQAHHAQNTPPFIVLRAVCDILKAIVNNEEDDQSYFHYCALVYMDATYLHGALKGESARSALLETKGNQRVMLQKIHDHFLNWICEGKDSLLGK